MSMKRTLFLVFLLSCAGAGYAQGVLPAPYLPAQANLPAAKNAPITVQYPYENMTVARGAEQIFIFGQVNLPQPATLEINGEPVELFKNGAFIAYLPVQSGAFTFELTASSGSTTTRAVRHITVPGKAIASFAEKAAFDEEEVFPQRRVEVLPGESIPLYVRGTPGAQVTAHLPALKNGKNIPLQEGAPGIYRGNFTVDPTQKEKATSVQYKMKDGPDQTKAKITAPALIYVRDGEHPYTYARVTKPGVKLRSKPTASGNLYPDYRAYGTVRVSGEKANQYRLQLSDRETAWLEKTHLQDLKGEPAPNTLSFIRTLSTVTQTRLTFTLDRPVPIKIHEYPDRLELALYDVNHFEQDFSLDDTSPVLENIQWAEPGENVVAFRLNLRPHAALWGYAYQFDGNELVIDLNHQPVRATTTARPLAGVRIALDAGHSPRRTAPYDGAVGPTGYLEYEATYALAMDLVPLLEKAGATVLLTRQGDNQMTLQNRYDFAREHNADIFISLHYNALPETANPLARPRGFTVYYTYPHSLPLAQSVYQAFSKHVPLPDNGLIQNDVLFIPRMSDYPSILVENAFLILPEQEELARTPTGRALFVKALYEGIVNLYKRR